MPGISKNPMMVLIGNLDAGVKEVKACSPHVVTVGDKVRYLRLHIDKGAAGLWEWKIY